MNYTLSEILENSVLAKRGLIPPFSLEFGLAMERALAKEIMPPVEPTISEADLRNWGAEFLKQAAALTCAKEAEMMAAGRF